MNQIFTAEEDDELREEAAEELSNDSDENLANIAASVSKVNLFY